MHEIEFCESFCPQPAMVLGLRMETYTIAHEMTLLKKKNPLLLYTESSFKEIADEERGRALSEAVLQCSKAIPRWIKIWVNKSTRMNIDEEVKKFRIYRLAGSQDFPTTKMPRTPGVSYHYFGAPELARLINYVTGNHAILIQAHFKGSPLHFPLGLAKMLYTASLEASSAIWVENHQDAESKARRDLWEQTNPDGGFAYGDEAVRKSAERWNKEHPETPVHVEPKEKP